jgi:hypothetical protein
MGDIWVEKVKIETSPLIDINELKVQHTPIAVILDFINDIEKNDEMLRGLLAEFEDIQQALPYELKTGEEGFDFTNPELIKEKLADARDLILYYLTKTGVES